MATIRINKDNRIFDTKKVSSRYTGSGNTIIATSTRMPIGMTKPPINDFTLPIPNRDNVISMTGSLCQILDGIDFSARCARSFLSQLYVFIMNY
jgi:hypothetical protein